MTAIIHKRTKGDTLTPLAATLKQLNDSGVETAVNLTGKTVKFKMATQTDATKVALTSTGVTVVSAAEGTVQYQFSAAGVDTVGCFHAWFVVTSASKTDHFPADGKSLIVEIVDSIANS